MCIEGWLDRGRCVFLRRDAGTTSLHAPISPPFTIADGEEGPARIHPKVWYDLQTHGAFETAVVPP